MNTRTDIVSVAPLRPDGTIKPAEPARAAAGTTRTGIGFYGGYQVYSDTGVDLTLLRENLRMTPTERLEAICRNIPFYEEFAEAGRRRREGVAPPSRRLPVLDLAGLLRRLNDHQVDYVVIGGLAMIAHGSAHVTKDLDICYARTPKNLAAVEAAFTPLHPYLRGAPPGLPFRFDAATLQAGLNFTLTTDLGPVDVLGEVAGIETYDQVRAQAVEYELYGLRIRVLSLDGLIIAKRAAGRVKDHNHLLELEEMRKMRDDDPTGAKGNP